MPTHRLSACPLKRWGTVLYAGALTCLALNALHAQNLINNPGFENGTNGWFSVSVPLTITTASPFSGSACATATLTPYSTWCGQTMLGKLQPGQTYTWSAWMRTTTLTTPPTTIAMRLSQTDSTGTSAITATKSLTTSWALYTTAFSLSVTGILTDLSVTFVNGNGQSPTVYLDEVSITNSSPVLDLMRTNQSVLLSWPTKATNYTLETTTNLAAPVNWVAVTNTVLSNASAFSLTLPATNRSSFFRLQHP